MFLDGMSFLEEEREAWRPYEALEALSDDALERSVEAARGWSGRDLMAHLVAWQDVALQAAKELAVGEAAPTIDRVEADWDARGDALNADILAEWAALPIAEVRRRFRETSGELRGYLTVVPEARWVKDSAHMGWFNAETLEHYEEHHGDLAAILAAAE